MMVKKILVLGVASLLFLGRPTQALLATTTTSEENTSSEIVSSSIEEEVSSEVLTSSEEEEDVLENIIDEQLAQLESIIVALFASFAGTGTVALIIRLALSKLTKQMTKKVTDAEAQNKISTEQAQQAIKSILDFELLLKGQVDALDNTVKNLIQNQNITNENIKMMLDEFKQRDEQIKDLIIKEFGDEINE
jgi:hypothetical protein